MNDRFRFRVYSPVQETIGEVEKIDFEKSMVFDVCGEGYRIDEVVLMQCTGLKDKNGKLIYEGDIVKDRNGLILQVSFKKDYACFCFENADLIGYLKELRLCCFKIEIIGNIYENRELLSEVDDE